MADPAQAEASTSEASQVADVDNLDTEAVAQALIREHLIRTGRKDVLKLYDQERVRIRIHTIPHSGMCASPSLFGLDPRVQSKPQTEVRSKALLAKALGIAGTMKKNKARGMSRQQFTHIRHHSKLTCTGLPPALPYDSTAQILTALCAKDDVVASLKRKRSAAVPKPVPAAPLNPGAAASAGGESSAVPAPPSVPVSPATAAVVPSVPVHGSKKKMGSIGSDSVGSGSVSATKPVKKKMGSIGSDSVGSARMGSIGSSSVGSSSKYGSVGSGSAAVAASAPELKFTAPDGKKFATRSEMRRYTFKTFYTFTDRSGETLMKKPGDISGYGGCCCCCLNGLCVSLTRCTCVCVCCVGFRQPFNLTNLDNCEVMLLDHSDQVQVDVVKNSKLFIGMWRVVSWEMSCLCCNSSMHV